MTWLVIAILAQGGPPLLTDDPGTPGAGRVEFNIAVVVETRHDERALEAPLLDANFGIGERIQLKIELPWLTREAEGEAPQSGPGNGLIGLKFRILDEGRAGVAVSFYPQVEFNTLPNSRDRGIVEQNTELFLPVEAAKSFGWINVNVEAGFRFHQYGRDELVFGLALGREVLDRLELIGEIHSAVPSNFSGGDTIANVGFRLKLTELNSILFAMGRGVHGDPMLLAYVGLQFNF